MNYDLDLMLSNYKKTTDAEIRELLTRIKLVTKTHKGIGTMFGYYELNKKLIENISEKPRNVSHTFEDKPVADLVEGLKEMKTISVYVKSSSRFYLKPDIGEVFDQMSDEDKKVTKAIFTNTKTAKEIDGTSGEHFLLEAVLFDIPIKKKRSNAYKAKRTIKA